MKLAMVMKVKDEGDILEETLRYHAAQGVDIFIVTDNGSTDNTPEILARWEQAGRAHVINEPSKDFYDKAHWWVTRMARLAATEHGCDWVLHCDADEFWWPVEGNLKSAFEAIPDRYGIVVGPRIEFLPRPGSDGSFFTRLTARETQSSLRPKIAHRAEPDVVLKRGAHDVDVEREGDMPKAGRPVLRGVRDLDPEDDRRLIFSPTFPCWVMHLPLRSFDQYERRVRVMIEGSHTDKARRELAEHAEAGRLPQLYDDIVWSQEKILAAIEAGDVVGDERLRNFMATCPSGDEILSGAKAPAFPPLSPEAARAELDDIAWDAMRAITRTEQGLIRLRDDLRGRLKTSERKLKKARKQQTPDTLRKRVGLLLGRD